jgi:cell fate (sporulation/competence/biofilm development) regulator YlbF (YheA/YmcA/DUF963 family)
MGCIDEANDLAIFAGSVKMIVPHIRGIRTAVYIPAQSRWLAFAFGGGMWLIKRPKIEIIMSTKVETKTRELCEAIIEHIETGGIKKRIDTFLTDTAAKSQYESLMNKGQALQEKQHSGQTLEPAEISAFEQDRDALLKNPVAASFLDAQEEMHELQHLVQKNVGKTIELGRIPTAEDLNGGSCDSHGGCGCHH